MLTALNSPLVINSPYKMENRLIKRRDGLRRRRKREGEGEGGAVTPINTLGAKMPQT